MTTREQMTREETEFRKSVGFTHTLPPNVITALFACPTCNWPIVTSMFTEKSKGVSLHEAVFELVCGGCKWSGAMLGRDLVDSMVNDWTSHKVLISPITNTGETNVVTRKSIACQPTGST